VVTYDKDLGLVFLDGHIALPEAWRQRLEVQCYQSGLLPSKFAADDGVPTRMQSYRQHIGGLADAYHYVIRHELAYAMQHLEALMGLEEGTIDHAIQLAIATHDLGKLDAQWQRWARAWQRLLYAKKQWSRPYQEQDPSFFFAKTDYDYRSNEQREWQKELSIKRPKHACESVMVGRKLILHSLGVASTASPNYAVARAVCSAVAHHHTPTAHDYGATNIPKGALAAVEEAFEVVRRGSGWNYELGRLARKFERGDLSPVNALTRPDVVSGPEKLRETWLAFLIVRALRLADQRADLYC